MGLEDLVGKLRGVAKAGQFMKSLEVADLFVAALQADLSWLASDVKHGGLVFVAGATTGYTEAPCMVRHALDDSIPSISTVMKVLLQKISGAEPSVLEVSRLGTLADLRRAVCEVEACTVYSFSLLLKADVLEETCHDSTLLSECGVKEGVTLTLVKKRRLMVLTASADMTAKIFDSTTGECRRTLSGHVRLVQCAVFSPDGSLVLTASDD